MKLPQLVTIGLAALLCIVLVIFVPRENKKNSGEANEAIVNQALNMQTMDEQNKTMLEQNKMALSVSQKQSLYIIENQLNTSKSTLDSIKAYQQLSRFWLDSAKNNFYPSLYYTYNIALLENSEKSLTFAAQLLVNNLTTQDAIKVNTEWIARNAKVLLDKALEINPNNDTTNINLGACYAFGNISNNPQEFMPVILNVKRIVDRNPNNTLGQLVLGMGGIISRQFDKAIDRFKTVLKLDPNNFDAKLRLAECFELINKKDLAIEWYMNTKQLVKDPEIAKAIEEKIKELKK